jgi:UDP-2-acetamido-3-amino-2,3-dideoxy-glucuronate N-acetyltransferase
MDTMTPEAILIALPTFSDPRGSLAVAQYSEHLPFIPQRIFFQFDVPSETTRGEHAHRKCHQALICVHGQMTVETRDVRDTREFHLSSGTQMLHLPPMVWAAQYGFSAGAVCLVLASDLYDADDYIRDLSTWQTEFSNLS